MLWFWILGLISLLFIFAGFILAIRRIRSYKRETLARRARAFAEMMEIGKRQGEGRGTLSAGEAVRRDD